MHYISDGEFSIQNLLTSVKAKLLLNWVDMVLLGGILCLNPVTFHFKKSLGYFPPDVISYLYFGSNLFSTGKLFVENDSSCTILPPVYPFFIGLGKLAGFDLFLVSEWISSLALLASFIPIYFIIKQLSNRLVAVAGLCIVNMSAHFIQWAFFPLTEAMFIFLVTSGLCFVICWEENSARKFAVQGVMAGLIFLTRQIGLTFFGFMIIYLILSRPPQIFKKAVIFIAFFLLPVLPYSLVLYQQTQHTLFTQSIQLEEAVITNDPVVINAIENIRKIPEYNYISIYHKRRLMRELTPDCRYMFFQVKLPTDPPQLSLIDNLANKFLEKQRELLINLKDNVVHLMDVSGKFGFILLLITLISPFVKFRPVNQLSRLVPIIFIIMYILILSLITGIIDRYIQVLLPFIIIHLVIEIYRICELLNPLLSRFNIKRLQFYQIFFIWLIFILVIQIPGKISDLNFQKKTKETEQPEYYFRQFTKSDEKILVLSSFNSYILGGIHMVIPNDTLERVIQYAKYKKIKWLFVSRTTNDMSEIQFYSKAGWYLDPNLTTFKNSDFHLTASRANGKYLLFRIDTEEN